MENKFKHNKKRNTAFLYECMIRELTKCMIEKNDERRNSILMILKEYFSQDTNISKDLKIYRSFQENSVEEKHAEKFLNEIKLNHLNINKKDLFNEQTSLINTINKTLGVSVYSNFVPNYKNLATIAQIFNETTPIKEKILLEETLKNYIIVKTPTKKEELLNKVDKVVYKTLVEKFNDQYKDKLLKEQKELLNYYVKSSEDGLIEFKVFVNEEVGRLKKEILSSMKLKEIKEDEYMLKKVNSLKEFLDNFRNKPLNEESLSNLLKIQQFVHEVKVND